MQKGIKNEIEFVQYLNHKMVKDLSQDFQQLLYQIYNNKIYPNSKIQCWRSKYLEKSDIKIRINNIIKGLSIKSGKECSMHQEEKTKFYKFLQKIGVSDDIIFKFDQFMIGRIDGIKVDSKTYKAIHPKDIIEINEELNRFYIKNNLLIRFIFIGTELQLFGCDALIHGNPASFLWATNDEILAYLSSKPSPSNTYLNIGNLSIKCYDRNLKNIPSRKGKENDIQVKWQTIIEDLEAITYHRNHKNMLMK